MKKSLIKVICFITLLTTNFNCYAISELLDNQIHATYKQPNMYYYSDTSYWREKNLTNEDFATLYQLYKRGIITRGEYGSLVLNLSRNQHLCTIIYKDKIYNIRHDLEFSEISIRAALTREELSVFYSNLLAVIPPSKRIGSLDDYLLEQQKKWNGPRNVFEIVFGK
jgi:hypothetical protein